jgi:hypothetical protein
MAVNMVHTSSRLSEAHPACGVHSTRVRYQYSVQALMKDTSCALRTYMSMHALHVRPAREFSQSLYITTEQQTPDMHVARHPCPMPYDLSEHWPTQSDKMHQNNGYG